MNKHQNSNQNKNKGQKQLKIGLFNQKGSTKHPIRTQLTLLHSKKISIEIKRGGFTKNKQIDQLNNAATRV